MVDKSKQTHVVLYRGMSLSGRDEAERLMKEGIVSSGYHYFGNELGDILKEFDGIDVETATLRELRLAQDCTNPAFRKKHPGKNYMPLASLSSSALYASLWSAEREDGRYVFRVAVPNSKTADSFDDVNHDTVVFRNDKRETVLEARKDFSECRGKAFDKHPDNIEMVMRGEPYTSEWEWLTVKSKLPAEFIAGFFDMKTGEYVSNPNHIANEGFDPKTHILNPAIQNAIKENTDLPNNNTANSRAIEIIKAACAQA